MSERSVLFVCMGNICRSPTAHAVFRHYVSSTELDVHIDSAGTIGYHTGCPPDPRSRAVGEARGYGFYGISARQVQKADFEIFDFVLAMDRDNLRDLRQICPPALQHKVKLFLSFGSGDEEEVPDPYYGGERGFEHVLDLVEDACQGLLQTLQRTR